MSAILVLNPRSDKRFVEFATELASGSDDVAQMQKLLRERYPAAVVRARDLSSETAVVWYVYRDGSWTAGGAATEG